MLGVVDEEVVGVFVARITKPLYGLLLEKGLSIAEAAKAKTVRPEVLGEVAFGNAGGAGFEHEHLCALLAQNLSDPATARSGADYDGIVGFGRFIHRL